MAFAFARGLINLIAFHKGKRRPAIIYSQVNKSEQGKKLIMRLRGHLALVFACFLACAFLSLCKVEMLAKGKKKGDEPFALLMGTCFNERGFSLSGVSIVVELKSDAHPKPKKRKWQMISSPRGQFAVRLPAGNNTFLVSAAKKEFKPLEKTVIFQQDERQDIIFNMGSLSE